MVAVFVCSNCGYGAASWYGRCPSCSEWNTMTKREDEEKGKKEATKEVKFVPLSKISTSSKTKRKKTGVFEFDRVLGGGLIKGEAVLLSGDPGVGKSTLLLKALSGLKTIYISGEESAEQISYRAQRIGVGMANFLFSSEIQIDGILKSAKKKIGEFDVMVIDSIQTVYSRNISSGVGSISQLRESSARLVDFAKKNDCVLMIVGHITKGGDIAGPKILEHLVDCVLYLEGEKFSHFRILRSNKNRFGPTDEVGVFEMKEEGLVEVDKPTAFLGADQSSSPGKAIVGVTEGSRLLFFEVQSLVVPTSLAYPRRVVSGLDYNKVLLLLAVLKKHLRLPLDRFDVHVNVAGGVSIKSTAADLGIVASVISSFKNSPAPKEVVFSGEVGLLGEVRRVLHQEKIVRESKRFGFKRVYSSENTDSVKKINRLWPEK